MKIQIGAGLILAAAVVVAQTPQNATDTPEAHVAIAQTAAGEEYQNLFNFLCAAPAQRGGGGGARGQGAGGAGAGAVSLTREEVIYHLINHGTYHRGAIGHALDLARAPRPADTYTVFVHAAEPERRAA